MQAGAAQPAGSASGGPDTIGKEMDRLVAEHRKDYSRQDALQQFVALGMAHERYDAVEAYLTSFIDNGASSTSLYHLVATVQEKQKHYNKAVGSILALFRTPGPKTEAMYEAAGRILQHAARTEHLETGRQLLEEGLKARPQNKEMLRYLMEIYQILGLHEKALPWCEAAMRLTPSDPEPFFFDALIRMIASNLTDGFDSYKRRFELEVIKKHTPAMPWPSWQGEPLAGKKVFVWSEQGVGEVMMWSGLLPWVPQQGADMMCAVEPRMLPLFRRSFPSVRFVEKNPVLSEDLLNSPFDYQFPMGNIMPYALPNYRPAEQNPAHLVADREAVSRKRQEYLAQRPNATRVVGISWHSTAGTGWRRNIPLEVLKPLLQDPETVYVSLQYNQRLDDVDHYNRSSDNPIVMDLSFIPVVDIDAWATQHAALDQIISIQNSSVHLGGALGVPTTLLLSSYGAFHWGNARNPNPWYRSVTIHQQKPGQDWAALISEIVR